jgi:chromosome segregation ATPase
MDFLVGLAYRGAHEELGSRVRDLLGTPIACQTDSDLDLRKAIESLYLQTGPPVPVPVPDVAMVDAIVTRLQTQLVDIDTRGKRIVELQAMCRHTQDEVDRIKDALSACRDQRTECERDLHQAKTDEIAIREEAAVQAKKITGCLVDVAGLKAELDGVVFERNLLQTEQLGMQKAIQACETQVDHLLRDQNETVRQRDASALRFMLIESELTFTQQTLEGCQADVAMLNREKEDMEGEMQHCRDQCDMLQTQIDALTTADKDQLEVLQKQLATLDGQVKQGETHLSELNNRVSERETEIVDYRDKLTALEAERNALRDRVLRTQGELQRCSDDMQRIESEKGLLQQSMQGCQTEVAMLSDEKNAIEGKLSNCETACDQLEDAAESDNQEIDRLRNELALAKKQVLERENEIAKLAMCEADQVKQRLRLENDLSLAAQHVMQLGSEKRDTEEELQRCKDAYGDLDAQLKLTNDQDHNAIDMLQNQLAALNVQVIEGETKLSQVNAQLTSERDGLEEIRKQLHSCQGQLGDATLLEIENQQLRDSLDGATTRVLELRGETDLLYKRVDDLELERVTLMDEVNELNRAPVECSRQLQEQLEIAHKGIEMLNLFKPDDDVVSQGLEGLREALRKTHEIVEGLKSKSNRFQKERNKVEKQLKECNSQLSQKRLGIIK